MNVIFFVVGTLWGLGQAFMASRYGMLTATQMMRKYPGQQGVPYIWHLGLWSNLLFTTAWMAIITNKFSDDWSKASVVICLMVGLITSLGLHLLWGNQGQFPDSLVWKGELSLAGRMHVVYAGTVVAMSLLFYFYSTPSPTFLIGSSIYISIHMVVGNQLGLGALKRIFHFPWCPDFFGMSHLWLNSGIICVIIWTVTVWKLYHP